MTAAMLVIALTLSVPITSPATWVMLAKNGKVMVVICRDHKLRVFSLPDAKITRSIDVPAGLCLTAISDDGRSVLIADYRGGVHAWDTSTGDSLLEQHVDHYLTAAAFSHDGRLLATAPGDAAVTIFDLATRRALFALASGSAFTGAIAFSRDGKSIATAEGDGVSIFDATGKKVAHNDDFSSEPLTLDFSPDGKEVAAAGADKVVVFIDNATGKTSRRIPKSAEAVFYVEVSPDGHHVAAVTLNANAMQAPAPIIVYEVASLEKKNEWTSPGSLYIATWMEDHFVAVTATPEAVNLWRVW